MALPVMRQVQHASLATLGEGQLVYSGGCFYLMPPVGTQNVALIWPQGYRADDSPAGVYSANGTLVARPGDKLYFGGSPVITDHVASQVANTACLADAKEAWIIDTVSRH